MGNYAKVEDGIVTEVIVADSTFINSLPDSASWVKTSFNTLHGKHYEPDTNFGTESSDQSKALRKNYAGIGYHYDSTNDYFYPPKPEGFNSWTLDSSIGDWVAPLAKPSLNANQEAVWDEDAYQADNTTGWTVIDT